MHNLIFSAVVGLSHYGVLSLAKRHFWERAGWFSLDRERLARTLIAAGPVLLTITVFQTLIAGRAIRLSRPTVGGATLLSVCFLIPVIEEWVRGMVIAFWEEARRPLVGLVLSSLLFATLHSLKVDFVSFQAFTFGLLSGSLIIWSKGVAPSILLHIFANILIVSMVPI